MGAAGFREDRLITARDGRAKPCPPKATSYPGDIAMHRVVAVAKQGILDGSWNPPTLRKVF
jgi:hypothetical protein